jgi:hypothetical protein
LLQVRLLGFPSKRRLLQHSRHLHHSHGRIACDGSQPRRRWVRIGRLRRLGWLDAARIWKHVLAGSSVCEAASTACSGQSSSSVGLEGRAFHVPRLAARITKDDVFHFIRDAFGAARLYAVMRAHEAVPAPEFLAVVLHRSSQLDQTRRCARGRSSALRRAYRFGPPHTWHICEPPHSLHCPFRRSCGQKSECSGSLHSRHLGSKPALTREFVCAAEGGSPRQRGETPRQTAGRQGPPV